MSERNGEVDFVLEEITVTDTISQEYKAAIRFK
jgi:hypothetical protein